MHALCVLVMACAVAAGSGQGQGEVRASGLSGPAGPAGLAGPAAALTRCAPLSLRAAAIQPALHAVLVRHGRRHSPGARASHPSLPPVALTAGWSLDPLRRAITTPARPADGRRAERWVRTGSARGPPIA